MRDTIFTFVVFFIIGVMVCALPMRAYYENQIYKLEILHKKKMASKELQLNIVQSSYAECRYIVDRILIQPRPLEVE